MGKVLELVLSYENLMKFAAHALEVGDSLTCALNLNEALTKAEGSEQVRRVYELFVECYRTTYSPSAVMQTVMKEIENRADGTNDDYYRFDFYRRKRSYDIDFEEETDYKNIRMCNDIKNKIIERKYEEAMLLFSTAKPDFDSCEGIIDALNDAVDIDKKVNIDKYLIQMLALMSASSSKVEILRLMLRGGVVTHRMMIESADFLLEEDDTNDLCYMGIAFFEDNELPIAKKFFQKVLLLDPINEKALYHMTVIKILTKDRSDPIDYWSRYKQVYKITEPPIRTMEEFFKSADVEILVPYENFPSKFVIKKFNDLACAAPSKGDITQEYAEDLIEFCKYASEYASYYLMDVLGSIYHKPVLIETYKKLLTLSRVSDALKKRIMDVFVDSGYEGMLSILTEDDRVVVMKVTKLHKRVYGVWNDIYRTMIKNSPFSKFYLPIHCADLAVVIKKIAEAMPYPYEEDSDFCLALVVINYIKRIRVNIDYLTALQTLDIDSVDMDKGLKSYGLKDIFI